MGLVNIRWERLSLTSYPNFQACGVRKITEYEPLEMALLRLATVFSNNDTDSGFKPCWAEPSRLYNNLDCLISSWKMYIPGSTLSWCKHSGTWSTLNVKCMHTLSYASICKILACLKLQSLLDSFSNQKVVYVEMKKGKNKKYSKCLLIPQCLFSFASFFSTWKLLYNPFFTILYSCPVKS